MTDLSPPADYPAFLAQLTTRIRSTQVRAALAVNAVLVELYWRIGREILQQQEQQGWGTKVIDQLAQDLRREFPALTGFSSRNLKYMRAFAKAWPEAAFVQQVVAQIPWGHNVRLLEVVQEPAERAWYAQQTIEHGWSRNVLVAQVESGLYLRQGRAVSNFAHTLPAPQSDLAQQLLKDPYTFDFLALGSAAQERELERSLLAHVRSFLLELGKGFALIGSQYPLEVGGQDYYLDLLFYHLTLRCFVVIDLKMGEFKPEDSGRRVAAPPQRPAHHWPHPVQDPQPGGVRVCPARAEPAHRRGRMAAHPCPATRAPAELAQQRRVGSGPGRGTNGPPFGKRRRMRSRPAPFRARALTPRTGARVPEGFTGSARRECPKPKSTSSRAAALLIAAG